MMKRILFCCLLLSLLGSNAMAEYYRVKIDGISYRLFTGDHTAKVWHDNYSGTIVIPSTVVYNNITYSVTGISGAQTWVDPSVGISDDNKGAFEDCTGLTGVKIPNSVTYIGKAAFGGCTGLVKAIAAGTATITATVTTTDGNDHSLNCALTVTVKDDYVNTVQADKNFDVYAVTGMKVRRQASTLDDLPKGIYVVNGHKVMVK